VRNANDVRRNRWISVAALAAVICVAGAVSFIVARSAGKGRAAQAGAVAAVASPVATQAGWPPYPSGKGPGRGPNYIDPPGPDVTPIPGATPDTSQPWWYVPYSNAEQRKPLFQGDVNGIAITLGDAGPDLTCAAYSTAELSVVDGTPLAISLSYVPPKTSAGPISHAPVVLCDGRPASSEARFTVASDELRGVYGGDFAIYRYRSSVARAQAFVRVGRWSAGTVAGIPAAVGAPILPDIGLGSSAIVFYNDGVVTRVTADGLPLKQVQQIAEGLLR